MKRETYRTNWLAATTLAMGLTVLPCLAQNTLARNNGFHSFQQSTQHSSAPAYHPAPAAQSPHQESPQALQHGHAGDWLRQYKDLSPKQQDVLRQRLRHFSSLSPQQQLRVLNRMETWEHLTPDQKGQARQIFNQMRQLPPGRQHMVITAIHDLRSMPPDQRENVI